MNSLLRKTVTLCFLMLCFSKAVFSEDTVVVYTPISNDINNYIVELKSGELLSDYIPDSIKSTVKKLTISGPVKSADIKLLRQIGRASCRERVYVQV